MNARELLWSCQLAPTKTCMLFFDTVNGSADSSAIAGYDPKSKAWKEVFFLADGSHLTQFYRAASGALSGDPVGKVIKGRAELVDSDGKIEAAQIQVRVLGLDKYEYSAVKRRIGNEQLPDLVWVSEREKK